MNRPGESREVRGEKGFVMSPGDDEFNEDEVCHKRMACIDE